MAPVVTAYNEAGEAALKAYYEAKAISAAAADGPGEPF